MESHSNQVISQTSFQPEVKTHLDAHYLPICILYNDVHTHERIYSINPVSLLCIRSLQVCVITFKGSTIQIREVPTIIQK